MKKINSRQFLQMRCLGLSVLVIILDQVLKYKIRLSGGFYVCNSDISFNLHVSFLFIWLVFTFLALFSLLIYLLFKKNSKIGRVAAIGLSLILAGASSNILDRIFFGCVFDYINLFKSFFPIFNLADLAIFMGSFLIIVHLFKPRDL